MSRDPRVDPQPGDVLILGDHDVHITDITVRLPKAAEVRYSVPRKYKSGVMCECTLSQWRLVMTSAKVVHVEDSIPQ